MQQKYKIMVKLLISVFIIFSPAIESLKYIILYIVTMQYNDIEIR